MYLSFCNGNLLKSQCEAIVQQVNCKGVMGAGLAKQIRSYFPDVYTAYRGAYKRGELKLGHVVTVDSYPYVVYNLCAQNNYGYVGMHTDYEALQTCLYQVAKDAKARGFKQVGLPYGLGCGLAGGDWRVVEEIIRSIAWTSEVQFIVYKL